jgi:hypothetical protein
VQPQKQRHEQHQGLHTSLHACVNACNTHQQLSSFLSCFLTHSCTACWLAAGLLPGGHTDTYQPFGGGALGVHPSRAAATVLLLLLHQQQQLPLQVRAAGCSGTQDRTGCGCRLSGSDGTIALYWRQGVAGQEARSCVKGQTAGSANRQHAVSASPDRAMRATVLHPVTHLPLLLLLPLCFLTAQVCLLPGQRQHLLGLHAVHDPGEPGERVGRGRAAGHPGRLL